MFVFTRPACNEDAKAGLLQRPKFVPQDVSDSASCGKNKTPSTDGIQDGNSQIASTAD